MRHSVRGWPVGAGDNYSGGGGEEEASSRQATRNRTTTQPFGQRLRAARLACLPSAHVPACTPHAFINCMPM